MRRSTGVAIIVLLVAVGCRSSTESEQQQRGTTDPTAREPPVGEPGMAQPDVDRPSKDIVAVARDAGNFKTLVTAIEAAELGATLAGPGPFTVFAPTDEAFAKVPRATLDALLADKDQLRAVLTYHVVPGKMLAADLTRGKAAELTTVNGREVPLDLKDGVKVGPARVVMADIEASNGVLHAIDSVLIPEGVGPQARAPIAPADDR